uniref:Uncharacterized protein n=1 Tax=Lepeophtheirus salmonis TaxID=72036 RepID=A0A0K2VH41_LEPSM
MPRIRFSIPSRPLRLGGMSYREDKENHGPRIDDDDGPILYRDDVEDEGELRDCLYMYKIKCV